MKEHPILFSGSMVRAILEGRKTQTRRVVKFAKLHPDFGEPNPDEAWIDPSYSVPCLKVPYGTDDDRTEHRHYPKWEVGDHLWVKETHQAHPIYGSPVYRADYDSDNNPVRNEGWPWRPSIFMPKRCSRITLEIEDIRVERLKDISDKDAIAEGIEFRDDIGTDRNFKFYGKVLEKLAQWTTCPKWSYQSLWESINGEDSWDANPFVWPISFRRIK